LDLHNDLVYYQSMPGLQLLHCIKFDAAVSGGESFFADSFAAAERLRQENPVAFEVLCRVPCAFAKDDPQRDIPASYYYATPHITCDLMSGAISCVRWAPAFEIPMALGGYMPLNTSSNKSSSSSSSEKEAPAGEIKTNHATSAATSLNHESDLEVVNEYYEAYNEFAKVLQTIKHEQNLFFRLKAGETVVFNQARMLHGREAFVEPTPGMRKLSGCYVNIDDFRSRCMARFACCIPEPIRVPNWTFTNGSGR
jgi:alpha-ketoglutarate-dependent taurine dioxygenase